MYPIRWIASVLLGLILALAFRTSSAMTHQTTLQEIAMTAGGQLGEIHPDDQGHLWVSEYVANTISRFDPTGNSYTRYSGLSGGITEAQLGPDDNIWFSGYDNGTLGHLILATNTVVTWTIPSSLHPFGMAFDDSDNLWISESDVARLYRFTPGTHQLCTYTLPNDSKSVYLYASAGAIWMGDYITDSMLRLNPTTKQLTAWPIPTLGSNSNPEGMSSDSQGNLWWGDGGLGAVGRLEPTANRITLYRNSQISTPNYVVVDADKVWYVDSFLNKFGVFNPALTTGRSVEVTPTTVSLAAPSCVNLGAGNSSAMTVKTDTIAYVNTDVADAAITACGWVSQTPPAKSLLYDIAVAGGRVWISDYGRDHLIASPDQYSARVNAACYSSYLPNLRR